jgi:hypothetical protein
MSILDFGFWILDFGLLGGSVSQSLVGSSYINGILD